MTNLLQQQQQQQQQSRNHERSSSIVVEETIRTNNNNNNNNIKHHWIENTKTTTMIGTESQEQQYQKQRQKQRRLLKSFYPSFFICIMFLLLSSGYFYSSGGGLGLVVVVNAYSTGAGSCIGGGTAVGDNHIDTFSDTRQVYSAKLIDGKVSLYLDDTTAPLLVGSITPIEIQRDYKITVRTEYAIYGFKGVLLRTELIEIDDTIPSWSETNFVPVDTSILQYSTICDEKGVVGITHTNAVPKLVVETILRFDQVPVSTTNTLRLDVNVVGVNNATASLYAYDAFYFQFVPSTNINTNPTPSAAAAGGGGPPTTLSPTISTNNLVNDIIGSLVPTLPPPTSSAAASRSKTTLTIVVQLICIMVVPIVMIISQSI